MPLSSTSDSPVDQDANILSSSVTTYSSSLEAHSATTPADHSMVIRHQTSPSHSPSHAHSPSQSCGISVSPQSPSTLPPVALAPPALPLLEKPPPGHRDTARDRFNPETGARLVAGVVCLSNELTHPGEPPGKYVLTISSSRHADKLVLPKGGWETHESCAAAALRELWEEAGVVATDVVRSETLSRTSSATSSTTTSSSSSSCLSTVPAGDPSRDPDLLLHIADARPPKDYSPAIGASVHADGSFTYKGLHLAKGTVPSRAEYHFFACFPSAPPSTVWPESCKRTRHWLTHSEALKALDKRPEMRKAVELSSILKQ
ncbi:hypothetical protein PYCC9005_005330 [Savitreella phatthalungensis]